MHSEDPNQVDRLVTTKLAEDTLINELIGDYMEPVFRYLISPAWGDIACWTLYRNEGATKFRIQCSRWNPELKPNEPEVVEVDTYYGWRFYFRQNQFEYPAELGGAVMGTLQALRISPARLPDHGCVG